MNWGVPGDLGWRGGAGPDVVDGADVAAVKAEARTCPEHVSVGGVGGCEREWIDWSGGDGVRVERQLC